MRTICFKKKLTLAVFFLIVCNDWNFQIPYFIKLLLFCVCSIQNLSKLYKKYAVTMLKQLSQMTMQKFTKTKYFHKLNGIFKAFCNNFCLKILIFKIHQTMYSNLSKKRAQITSNSLTLSYILWKLMILRKK